MDMFCYQCQEALKNTGCTVQGVCGKVAEEARLEDLIMYAAKGVALTNMKLQPIGLKKDKIDYKFYNLLFMTITNANFDADKLYDELLKAIALRDELRGLCNEHGVEIEHKFDHLFAPMELFKDREKVVTEFAPEIGVLRNADINKRALVETIIYGLKGAAAYLEHAANLGYEHDELCAALQAILVKTEDPEVTAEELVGLVLETGAIGVKAMALLDEANTSCYGNPEMTQINIGVGTRPGILISGHDLKDMEMLLEQSKDSGVDIYTHCEMLPANAYPAFKKYPHFVGNYGGAWWNQVKEFQSFNGPILFTSNCIVPYRDLDKYNYSKRVFTTNAAGLTGCPHIERDEFGTKDFTPIIEMAKTCEPPIALEEGHIMGGFAHNQVLELAPKVIEAIKSGAIKKFVVMAGCDGRMADRKYYTEFAEALPKDTVILTAGCAKFRYNKLNLGDIDGIPRVLDAGQCNDSYSLVVIALKLKEAFGLESVNDLPIVYNIAWYEQKAVIVLLALLYLGIKNIHLGPTLPAFISPDVLNVLVQTFGIQPITTVEEDMKKFGLK
jgi:hydroxylamine reductase